MLRNINNEMLAGLNRNWNGRPVVAFSLMGRNADFQTADKFTDLCEFTLQTAGNNDTYYRWTGTINFNVVSTSPNDTLAGTGARVIRLYYLDATNQWVTSQVNMNGTTPVNVVANSTFLGFISVEATGSGEAAAGDIIVTRDGGTEELEKVTAGNNRSLSGRIKIPDGWKGYINFWDAASLNQRADVRLRANCTPFQRALIPDVFQAQDIIGVDDGQESISDVHWLEFPAGGEIKLSASVKAVANAEIVATANLYLVKDDPA